MKIIRQRAFARAGLLGNPSDGYNGRTISLIVRNFSAQVVLYEWEHLEILHSRDDLGRFDSIHDLVKDVALHGYYGGVRLIKATIKRFAEFCLKRQEAGEPGYELGNQKFSIRYTTNIPRQVGMAGSSAIIVATLRGLMDFYGVAIPARVLPSLALSVERNELGIAAGLQDRVIQVYEGLVSMDFAKEKMQDINGLACGQYERLDADLLPGLYIAYTRDMSEPTEVLHNPLRARYDQGDRDVIEAMSEFAEIAQRGRNAILHRDHEQLNHLIDKNFDTRRRICHLAGAHVKMIEAARSCGASAKYCGSGGAIIGICEDDEMFAKLSQTLGSLNCSVIRPKIVE